MNQDSQSTYPTKHYPKHCVALMYHTLFADEEEWHALLDEEKPYAISTQTFEIHLRLLQQWGIPIISPSDMQTQTHWQPGVIITFDDGHRSHYTHALPLMKKYNMQGFFFITTQYTNTDPRFCNWQELHQLHQEGHAIHGHGHTHQFFADMAANDAAEELKYSFDLLKQHITQPWSMSFPGGRYTQRDITLAKTQGFSHLFTSEVDVIKPHAFQGHHCIPRFAIRNTTNTTQFKTMIMPSTTFLLQQKMITSIKKILKTILSNRGYHWLYTLKSKQPSDGGS